jgi:hypothetical protein
LNIYKVVDEVNKDPKAEFISECGKYRIDSDRYETQYQNGYPVITVSIKGLPMSLKWIKIK